MSAEDVALLGVSGEGVEIVRLTGIESVGRHGVYPEERRDGQRFVADVTLSLARASYADALETTVDYGALAVAVASEIAGEPVDLIETLARRIADRCLAERVVAGVVVTVHKPEAPISVRVGDASVTVVRKRT